MKQTILIILIGLAFYFWLPRHTTIRVSFDAASNYDSISIQSWSYGKWESYSIGLNNTLEKYNPPYDLVLGVVPKNKSINEIEFTKAIANQCGYEFDLMPKVKEPRKQVKVSKGTSIIQDPYAPFAFMNALPCESEIKLSFSINLLSDGRITESITGVFNITPTRTSDTAPTFLVIMSGV